jgi:hypothetical protein
LIHLKRRAYPSEKESPTYRFAPMLKQIPFPELTVTSLTRSVDSHVVVLSLTSSPPRVGESSIRLTRASLGDSQVDGERGLGHLLGVDASFRAEGVDVAVDGRVQFDNDAGGGVGLRGERVGVRRLRSTGGGLNLREEGPGVTNAGLGREDVGVGQRLRENGLALRGASQGGELGLAVAFFVRVHAFDHLEVGAGRWVGVDREVLGGRGEFGETLLHADVEAVELRAEDVGLPCHAVVLHASFELLEDGQDVAVAEEGCCGGGTSGTIALQKGGDDHRGASGFNQVGLGMRFGQVEFEEACFARHAGELEFRRHLAHESALGLVVAGDGGECGRLCGLTHRVVATAVRYLDRRRASGVSDGAGLRVCAREEGDDLHRAGHAGGVSGSRHVQEFDLLTLEFFGDWRLLGEHTTQLQMQRLKASLNLGAATVSARCAGPFTSGWQLDGYLSEHLGRE